MRPRRVISLLPSATEIVCALEATAELVGISHECDFPGEVRSLPVLTSSRISNAASSRAIDADVREVLKGALSIYEVDEVALAALEPDVIVTQDLCEVCAVSLDDVKSTVSRLAHNRAIDIVCLAPTRLGDVLDDIERVALALGRREQGHAVRHALEQRMDAIRERSARAANKPLVASIEWLEPIMLGGTWMPELIELAGGIPVGVEAVAPAPTLAPSELAALAPDVVLIKPCGFGLERTLRELDVVERNVTSVVASSTSVYLADGTAFFNRPGPRLVESLELLAACVHPELFEDFAARHRGSMRKLRPDVARAPG